MYWCVDMHNIRCQSVILAIITVIVIIVVYLYMLYEFRRLSLYKYNRVNLSDVIATMNTGDIIVTSTNYIERESNIAHHIVTICKSLYEDIINHTMVIVRIGDRAHIMTASREKHHFDLLSRTYKTSGASLIDMVDHLKSLTPTIFLYYRVKPQIDQSTVNRYLNYIYMKEYPSWYEILDFILDGTDDTKLQCAQLAAGFYKSQGLLHGKNHLSFSMRDIKKMLDDRNLFEQPVRLNIDM